MEIAPGQSLWLGLAGVVLLLALASQWVRRARFAVRASLFFAILAGFGWLQDWPSALRSDANASGMQLVQGVAWLVDVALAVLFLLIGIVLTLGRGRGGAMALLASLPVLAAGAGAQLGWWPEVLSWPEAPWAPMTAPGGLLLAIGALVALVGLGCLALQRFAPDPVRYAEPPRRMPLHVMGHPHDEDEDHDDHDPPHEEEDHDAPEASSAAAHDAATEHGPLLDQPWTPMRKHAIRRHRHRRATRTGH